jgi:hypothetical protein
MDELKARIDEILENGLSEIYEEMGITTGDITPEQMQEWERITAAAADLFAQLIAQNEENGVVLPF